MVQIFPDPTPGEGTEMVQVFTTLEWQSIWFKGLERAKEVGYLKRQNPVPEFDGHIGFNADKHEYTWEGRKLRGSVTNLIDKWFGDFNSERTAWGVVNSPKWRLQPDAKYYAVAHQLGFHREIEQHPEGWPTDPKNTPWSRNLRWRFFKAILALWDVYGDKASGDGTRLHEYIEAFYNQRYSPFLPAQLGDGYEYFHAFHRDVVEGKLEPWNTEQRMYDDAMELAGTIDMLYRRVGAPPESRELIMYDWKRTKDIRGRGGARAGAPFGHMRDNKVNKYSIQLNLYAYMLEEGTAKTSGWKVVEMWLAVFHPMQGTYDCIRVPKLRAEVLDIVEVRLDEVEEDKRVRMEELEQELAKMKMEDGQMQDE